MSALEYPVPAHANNLGWSLGGVTAAALAILIVTGVILVQFYSPVPETANASVRRIQSQVWGGGFVRGLHYWAAQAMYVTALLHMVRVFFTGTVLKWDQEGFEALGHNLEIGNLLGGAGVWFSPDFADQISILVRLYAAHVILVPGLVLVLATLHALLVKKHKISPHPTLPTDTSGTQAPAEEPTEPFTHHLRRIGAFGAVLLGVLGILAVLLPPAVGPPPVAGIEVTKPPWSFWWMFTLENWIGLPGILYGELIFFALLVLLPFVDRNPNRYWRRRPVAMAIAVAMVLAVVILTALMAFTPVQQHLGM